MELIWLGALVVFLIIEAACPVHLVSLWFAAGSLVAMIAAMAGGSFWLQIVLFAVVSCGLLACLWPVVKKLLTPKLTPTNIDTVIGSFGVVTQTINNTLAQGQVKLDAMIWTARSATGDPIGEGTRIQVDHIEGVKVFVTPAEVSANLS